MTFGVASFIGWRENKGIPLELLQTYPKNANVPNPLENIQLPP
jgi:hypothetical protein